MTHPTHLCAVHDMAMKKTRSAPASRFILFDDYFAFAAALAAFVRAALRAVLPNFSIL